MNVLPADTAAQVASWSHDFLGLTWEEVGAMLGTTGRTVQRWRDRDTVSTRQNQERLDAVDELRFWIATVFGEDHDAAHEWLRTRVLDLKGKTPLQAVKAGRIQTVSAFLATFHTGASI